MKNHSSSPQKLLLISPGILIIVVFYAAGICWVESLNFHAQSLYYFSLLLLSLLFLIHKFSPERSGPVSFFLLGLLFFLLGAQNAQTHLNPPADPHHIFNFIRERQTASIDGVLQKYPAVSINDSTGPETRFLVLVQALHLPAAPNTEMMQSASASGLVQITLQGLLPKDLKPGDRILVKANVSPISTYSIPGTFNYKKFLANQSIFIKGWVQSPDNIIKLHPQASSHLVAGLTYLKYLPERIRYHIAEFLDKTLKQPARGLYKAVLIGDRSDVSASVLENFTGAGCIHILAISGLHMGLLALASIAVFTWTLKRSTWLLLHTPVLKVAFFLSLFPLLIYAFIAGFNIPVQRALVMTMVFILAVLFDRPGNLINHILLAAFIILTWKPGAIFTASFQLSFAAVVAIALFYPVLYRHFFQINNVLSRHAEKPRLADDLSPVSTKFHNIFWTFAKWVLTGIILTFTAMLGTYPLLLFHFNRFSLVAPFTNLFVEPFICFWSLTLGLIASLCIPFFPALAKLLFEAGSFGLILADRICSFFVSLPFSSLWFPTPSPVEIVICYLFLLSVIAAAQLAGKKRFYSLYTALLFLCLLIATSAVATIAKQYSGSATVTFLDVGHGSSVLLQLPENKNILIDGGGPGNDRFNIGERLIGPYLWNQKISHLDAVVITHPHADHYNGLPFILTRFRPKTFWINNAPDHDKDFKELLDLAAQLGIETRVAATDGVLFQDSSSRLIAIHSGRSPSYLSNIDWETGAINPNDLSLVLRLDTNDRSFLFPADISASMAERLSRQKKQLLADVLMAPHHGSASSMNQDFIAAVAPQYVVISAGRNNPFNFPAKSFIDLQQKGIKVLTTGKDGTITFKVANGEIEVSRYQIN